MTVSIYFYTHCINLMMNSIPRWVFSPLLWALCIALTTAAPGLAQERNRPDWISKVPSLAELQVRYIQLAWLNTDTAIEGTTFGAGTFLDPQGDGLYQVSSLELPHSVVADAFESNSAQKDFVPAIDALARPLVTFILSKKNVRVDESRVSTGTLEDYEEAANRRLKGFKGKTKRVATRLFNAGAQGRLDHARRAVFLAQNPHRDKTHVLILESKFDSGMHFRAFSAQIIARFRDTFGLKKSNIVWMASDLNGILPALTQDTGSEDEAKRLLLKASDLDHDGKDNDRSPHALTLEGLKAALRDLSRQVPEDGQLLIFVNSHGLETRSFWSGICDSKVNISEDLTLCGEELRALLKDEFGVARETVIFANHCYSGNWCERFATHPNAAVFATSLPNHKTLMANIDMTLGRLDLPDHFDRGHQIQWIDLREDLLSQFTMLLDLESLETGSNNGKHVIGGATVHLPKNLEAGGLFWSERARKKSINEHNARVSAAYARLDREYVEACFGGGGVILDQDTECRCGEKLYNPFLNQCINGQTVLPR